MGAIYKGRDRLEDISSFLRMPIASENLKEDMDAMVAGGGRQLTRVTDTERLDWLNHPKWWLDRFEHVMDRITDSGPEDIRTAIDTAMASDEQDNREGGDENCPETTETIKPMTSKPGDSEPAPGLKLPTKNITISDDEMTAMLGARGETQNEDVRQVLEKYLDPDWFDMDSNGLIDHICAILGPQSGEPMDKLEETVDELRQEFAECVFIGRSRKCSWEQAMPSTREDCLEVADAILALLKMHQPNSVKFYAHQLELMRERAEKADARVRELSHELERYSAFQYEKYMEELNASQDRVQELEAQLAHESKERNIGQRCIESQHDQKIKAAERVAELEAELMHRDLMDDGEYRRLDVRLKEAEALLSRADGLLAGELKNDIDAFLGAGKQDA